MPSALNKTAILVFARSASRDQKILGFGQRADSLALTAVTRHTLMVASEASRDSQADVVVAYDGDVRWSDAVQQFEQSGESFEHRFCHAISKTFALGYSRVVVVGGDTPTLTTGHLIQAVQSDEICLGPSADGGFYLMGLDESAADVLTGLPWHTASLLDQLVARLDSGGHTVDLLERLIDLDGTADAVEQRRLLIRIVRDVLGVALINHWAPTHPTVVVDPLDDLYRPKHLSSRGPPASFV